jgi:hypothetical protein
MKKLLLSVAAMAAFGLSAQTTLFSDNFEGGSGNWTLNSGGFGSNDWIVNNAYVGSFFTSTPSQPGGITNSPNSQYLHIHNASLACGSFGECQALFLAGSGGDKTAMMTNNISTTGYSNVTINFYYLCNGAVGTTYGVVEYSTNNGVSWSPASSNYAGVSSWTSQSLTNAAWDNQAQLKFRFHWIEGTTGNDPAFSVDEVLITGVTGGATSITTTNNVAPNNWCFNTVGNLTVNFTSSGTFTAGNTYTAQLSDASGSFASPTAIGSISSTANSGVINAVVPAGTAAGTGYRIRVVSSAPATTGSDNGANLVINALPNVTLGAFSAVCVYDSPFTLTGGSPAGGSFSGPGVTLNVFNPSTAGTGNHSITYSYSDGNGCSNNALQVMNVGACLSLEEIQSDIVLYPNPTGTAFKIEGFDMIESLSLLDLNGRIVKTFEATSEYSVLGVPSGTYFVRFTANGENFTTRLIVQ